MPKTEGTSQARGVLDAIGSVTGGDSDAAWSRLGQIDPYYGVLSHERFHAARLNDQTREEFFATGERHVEAVFRTLADHLGASFRPRRALEFGCGVGRVLIPLAGRCDSVVGVDVSSGMLEEAERQCAKRGLRNVEFALTDDALGAVTGRFDLIHSYIVFQHISSARQNRILRRLVDLLDDGGVGIIHGLYRRSSGWLGHAAHWARKHVPFANGLVNALLLRQAFGTPFMQMNPLPLAAAFETLQRSGCGEIYLEFSNHGTLKRDNLGMMLFFRKVAHPSW